MNSSIENTESLRGKRILVTGAAGFIGSRLTRKLFEGGSKVSILIRPGSDLWRLEDIAGQIGIHYGDLGQLAFSQIQSKFSSLHMIYHLGACGFDGTKIDPEEILKTNTLGTLTLLKLARHLDVERFIYCGSCSEYGAGNSFCEDSSPNPISEYGVSKISAWMLTNIFHQNYGLPVVSLRPFMIYGPFEAPSRLIPQVITSVLKERDVELTTGEQTRDCVFIEDALDAFLRAGIMPGIIGETFNVSTGHATSIKDIVLTIFQLMNASVKPLFGVRPYREFELWSSSGEPSRTRNKLHWTAQTSLREGLQKTIHWFEENGRKYSAYVRQ